MGSFYMFRLVTFATLYSLTGCMGMIVYILDVTAHWSRKLNDSNATFAQTARAITQL